VQRWWLAALDGSGCPELLREDSRGRVATRLRSGDNGDMGGDDKYVFVQVSELTGDLFDRFYDTVLEPAFPPEELEDIETVRVLHYEPSPCVPGLVALRGGVPVGGALGAER
jgi:hypothetical protein